MIARIVAIFGLVVLPMVVNKTTENRFHGIKPHLREIWFLIALIYTAYLLWAPESERSLMRIRNGFGATYPTASYVLAAVLGAILFTGYWWFLGMVLPPTVHAEEQQQTPSGSSPGGTQINQTGANNSPIVTGGNPVFNYNLGNSKSDSKKLDDIKKLLESQAQGINEKQLLSRYPLGYVIFDVDHMNEVIPYSAKTILDKYELDWSGVGVSEPAPGRVIVRLPGLKARDGSVAIASGSTGGPKRVGALGGYGANDLQIWAEILAIGKDGTVFLVGFARSPFMPRPAPSR